jgi:tRNA pseudouridine55 synthase
MNGLLVVDKPAGMTSHDVVAIARRALGVRRIGHAGTLDPSATGVLLLGIGKAARLLRFLEQHDKEYRARVVFGASTTTQDADGDLVEERDASNLMEAMVREAITRFVGIIEQVPPMVSAVKVGGEPLYRKAWRGEVVEREPRHVRIDEIELSSFESGKRAVAGVRVRCSKGTYVRTLAADLGDVLGTGAHLEALRRTRVGPFDETVAIPLERISADHVRPMEDAVSGYPRRSVDETAAKALIQGKKLPAARIEGPYAVFGPGGLVAMAEDRGEETRSLCVVTEG